MILFSNRVLWGTWSSIPSVLTLTRFTATAVRLVHTLTGSCSVRSQRWSEMSWRDFSLPPPCPVVQTSWWIGGRSASVSSSSSRACRLSMTRRLSWSSRISSTEVSSQTQSTKYVIDKLIDAYHAAVCRYSLARGRGGTVCKLKKCDWNPPDDGHDKTSWFKGWEPFLNKFFQTLKHHRSLGLRI